MHKSDVGVMTDVPLNLEPPNSITPSGRDQFKNPFATPHETEPPKKKRDERDERETLEKQSARRRGRHRPAEARARGGCAP